MEQPRGNAIGPLAFRDNNVLPRASRKNFPRFNGDGSTYVEQHLTIFHKAFGAVNPQHEDVAIKMFVDTLVENVVD